MASAREDNANKRRLLQELGDYFHRKFGTGMETAHTIEGEITRLSLKRHITANVGTVA